MNVNVVINLLFPMGWGFVGGAISGAVYEMDWGPTVGMSELFQYLVIFGFGLLFLGLGALLTLIGEVQKSASKAAYWLEVGFARGEP